MSKHKHLFTDLTPVEGVFLKGIGGKVRVEAKGTLHLNFLDDKGEIHTFKIPDSYFVPELELTLLCPQQWAKQREQEFGFEDGAQFITKGDFFQVPMGSQPALHHCAHGLNLQSSHPVHCTEFQEVSHVHSVLLPSACVRCRGFR